MLRPGLNDLLKQTSRSFYLTLRMLPHAIRPQISLAYLLARTTDTIADTGIIPVEQRLEALQKLQVRIAGRDMARLEFQELASHQDLPAEQMLLQHVEESVAELDALPGPDAMLIRQVLETITSGQELDLQRFGGADEKNIFALANEAALDDYTFRVAGCVGKFWTEMCVTHLFQSPQTSEAGPRTFEELGVRFGKGLQLVNILRDLPGDLRKGRCYLPADQLKQAGLAPADLLLSGNEPRFWPVYTRYVDLAESYLAAGWDYTNLIPFTWPRLRLACAWPVLIGLETLKRLRATPVTNATRRTKISRAEVRRIIFSSILRYPFRKSWQRLARFKPRTP